MEARNARHGLALVVSGVQELYITRCQMWFDGGESRQGSKSPDLPGIVRVRWAESLLPRGENTNSIRRISMMGNSNHATTRKGP